LAWYGAMAASVSLLVAASVSFDNFEFDFNLDQKELEGATILSQLGQQSKVPSQVLASYVPSDQLTIRSRPGQSEVIQSRRSNVVVGQLKKRNLKSQVAYNSPILTKSKKNFNLRQPNFGVRFEGGFSANSRYVGPSFGFGVTMDLLKSEEISKKIYLGSSVQLVGVPGTTEKHSSTLKRALFVGAAYENSKLQNGKTTTWTSGAEYMLHSTDPSANKPMFKLFYTRSILGRLKVGPEVLFTRSFKKAYPGLRLALS